jgi:hypothetical protein
MSCVLVGESDSDETFCQVKRWPQPDHAAAAARLVQRLQGLY